MQEKVIFVIFTLLPRRRSLRFVTFTSVYTNNDFLNSLTGTCWMNAHLYTHWCDPAEGVS